MSKERVLTGITPTGMPHLGNYVGAIKPAIEASHDNRYESFYFLADYHALIKASNGERVARSTLEVAATWLALGLDTTRAVIYRQSDLPEILELAWILGCETAKGLMNRAHAYKALVAANQAAGQDPDWGITMGLFNYPVLMAADILMFNAHRVPVGRDQVQHLEMAREIARRFNYRRGEYFVLPEAVVDEQVATLPGLDGRKMSKSYNNTIPLWLPKRELRKAIMKIKTNSQNAGEPKDPDAATIFRLYSAFATSSTRAGMRQAFAEGISWSEVKERTFELINEQLAEARERYERLVANPQLVEGELTEGSEKARTIAKPFIDELRHTIGIRPW